ncbi:MAG TPA: MraY family glycosyltransferase [Bryobacteraceae bacterium]|nr:MraY family glycosyltransferase [Bryobacteraceae bacterium]
MGTLAILGVSSFLFALILTPLVRDAFLRWNVVDVPDNRRKLHVTPIPRIGGIGIFSAYLLAFGLLLAIPGPGSTIVGAVLPKVWGMLVAVVIVFATGLIDDLVWLSPKRKLAGQIAAALVAYFSGVEVHLLRGNALDQWTSPLFTVLWLVICTNAFNLIDGLDGLASGVGLLATGAIFCSAVAGHNVGLALVTVPLLGCLLGFIRYNFNPASVFLGDCGSLSLGFFLGCAGAIWSEKTTLLGMTAPLMVLSVPLMDTSLSVLRRFLRHKPIFGADRGHIHHRLLARGISVRGTALVLYAVCGVAAVFSVLQHTFYDRVGGILIVLFCVAVAVGIQFLGYIEFGITRRLLTRGYFRQIVDDEVHLKQLEKSLRSAGSITESWTALSSACKELGFSRVRLKLPGVVRDEVFSHCDETYQLRISLDDGSYVNIYQVLDGDSRPLQVASLARVLRTTMRIPELWAEVPSPTALPALIPLDVTSFNRIVSTSPATLEQSWNHVAESSKTNIA